MCERVRLRARFLFLAFRRDDEFKYLSLKLACVGKQVAQKWREKQKKGERQKAAHKAKKKKRERELFA